MKNKHLLALAVVLMASSVFAFSQTANLRFPDPSDPFEKLVLDEKEKLDVGFGFKTDVWLSESSDIQADPDKGIIINPAQVKKHINESIYKDTAIIIRLIMAHEKGHCSQFLYYPQTLLNGFNKELRKVVECQADILAGKYLYESFMESQVKEMSSGHYTDKMRKAGSVGLDLFFNLGENKYAQAVVHPAKEQRRTAFKVGRMYGSMNQQIIHLQQNGNIIEPGSIQAFQQNIKNLANNIAIIPGESIMDWSFREAKRIIHYSTADIGNLVFTMIGSNWSTDPSSPYFEYDFEVVNKGDYTLLTDFDVRVERVLRADSSNSLFRDIFTAQQYSYRLPPGKAARFTGRLKWNYVVAPGDENKFISVPGYPGQPGASVFVERADTAPTQERSGKEFGLTGSEYQAEKNLPIMLEKIRADAVNNFRNLVVGPGLKDATAKGDLAKYTTYTCFSPYSEINLTDFGTSERKPSVTYFIGQYENYTAAKTVFDRTTSLIKSSYNSELSSGSLGIVMQDESQEYSLKSYRFKEQNDETYFSLNYKKDETTNKYKVYINVSREL
jgi:predicted nucleic acid-binding protein